MQHAIGSRARAATLAAIVAIASVGCANGDPAGLDTENQGGVAGHSRRPTALSQHDLWRKLWEDHITWTRLVIIALLDDATESATNATIARLLENYEDFEDALAPYYDEGDVEKLGDLLKDHLTIAAALVQAAEDGDQQKVTSLLADWRANADQIAMRMAEMSPELWPFEDGQPMWQAHLDVTLQEAVLHLQGDTEAEIGIWEEVHTGGLEMADFFSSGVIHQFPGRFSRACRL